METLKTYTFIQKFDISEIEKLIEQHRKTYNYNISFCVIGKVFLNGESITFIYE